MKGIQINNFFNNHISLNGKKNNNKQPNLFFEAGSPRQPLAFDRNLNEEQTDEIVSYDTLTPQMKVFKKQPNFSNRKKRTNTIDPTAAKTKETKKSKGKKSSSYEKFRKTLSLDKYKYKQTEQEHQISKAISKSYKKSKTSRNKNQPHQSEGVRRSKSAVLKNTKPVESKQICKQVLKVQKRNIISADNSFKDATKKEIKKETQNLLKKKQQTDRVICKTARVESTKVKEKKHKDKILAEIQRSAQKEDKKSMKFLTQRKFSAITSSKSFLTSAKQSKPVSARGKKPGKRLFDSKQKDQLKIEDETHFYNKLEDIIGLSQQQENSEVKEALSELQSVLQGINSKKTLANQLKKFTSKLKNIQSKENSSQSQDSYENESNNDTFKKIKDFKNNLVKNKLNQEKKSQESKQTTTRQHQISNKKSSKKLLTKKKKLQDPEAQTNKNPKPKNLDENEAKILQKHHQFQAVSQPQIFKNTDEEESRYINSRNPSFFEERTEQQWGSHLKQKVHEQDSFEMLDERNKKYQQFLKSLQVQNKNKNYLYQKEAYKIEQNQQEKEQTENLIEEIEVYFKDQNLKEKSNYNSEKPKGFENRKSNNPILQRRRGQECSVDIQEDKNFLTNNCKYPESTQEDKDKLTEIQELRAFRQQSDQMMQKVNSNKNEQKWKNLTIQLNQNIQTQQKKNRLPSSPKYDDRYPHLIKSPKFSDIEITNILAVKEKCLASKHQKMNQLVEKMYQKELVSPKSYEYYVYQLKKQLQQETEGLDGFKEQASQILNEINKEKNDIKAIDELIREQKWEEARKLMKGDQKSGSTFFGFKKNKQKVYESFGSQAEIQVDEINKQSENSASKKNKISVIQNNINIVIRPQKSLNRLESQKSKQIHQKDWRKHSALEDLTKYDDDKETKKLKRQSKKVEYSESQQEDQNIESITKSLEFQFNEKFRLKSNEDLEGIIGSLPKDKVQQEVQEYLKNDKASSEEFQNYVYYQSEEIEEIIVNDQNNDENQQNEEDQLGQNQNRQLKQEGMFKFIEVAQKNKDNNKNNETNDSLEILKKNNNLNVLVQPTQSLRKVIKIDEQDAKENSMIHDQQESVRQQKILSSGLLKVQKMQDSDDNMSENNSLIELELRKGFESNLFFIKEYCISLCEYIRDNSELKNLFKTNISEPLQFNNLELLKNFRISLDGSYSPQYNSTLVPLQYQTLFRKPSNKAISLQLAKQFNKTYGPLKFWNVDLSKKGRSKFQMEKQTEAIFLNAILQVLNESLDFERPGSIFGKPLLWANSSKHLKNMKYLNGDKAKKVSEDSDESAETYDFIFGVAIARIIQWGSCLCGFLPDTAELENTEIDDDYVVHIRETRMALLLEKMLAEEEVNFNNSELEETEIMLYLGRVIAEQLLEEASSQIQGLGLFSFNIC